jgi:PIN domain nuclease of toxin-antitoxin system
MNLLLDTHILLWWFSDDARLSQQARSLIQDSSNTVIISAASAWEISIKKALGKLEAPDDLEEAVRLSGFNTLAIQFPHALLAGELPRHHDDPFDRLLIAQTKLEHLLLITHDKRLGEYDVGLILN